jgi:predicted metalloprotease
MANWNNLTREGNVQDRRGMAAGGLGIIGTLAVVGISLFLGVDPMQLLGQLDQQGLLAPSTQQNTQEFEGNDSYEQFSKRVLGSLDGYWEQNVENYSPATLVLFRGRTNSSCGGALSAVGPHYCPLDGNIYLDETFFEELETQFGAKGGDVAQAYVIAHEEGHHIQNLLGLLSEDESSQHSIQTELTADCLGGAWLGSLQSQNIYEPNEIMEAVDAASAVGDDNIQERTQGTVQPETWTHGSSEQRKQSLMKGYQNFEDPSVCIQR